MISNRQQKLVALWEILSKRFGDQDLRTLCFVLGVDYDDLPALGRMYKARELIIHLERRNQIPDLIKAALDLRPDISWDNTLIEPRGAIADEASILPPDLPHKRSCDVQIIVAVASLIGVVLVALGYWGFRTQVWVPIWAPQTAVARLAQLTQTSMAIAAKTPTPTPTFTASPTFTPSPTATPTSTPTPSPTPAPVFEFHFDKLPVCWSTRCYPGIGCYGGSVLQRGGLLEFPINFGAIPNDPSTPRIKKGQIQYTTEPSAGLPAGCPKSPLTNLPFGSRFQAMLTIPPELEETEVEFFVQTADYKWFASRPTQVGQAGRYKLESGTRWVEMIGGKDTDSQWGNRPVLKFGIEFKMNSDKTRAQQFVIRVEDVLVWTP